MVGGDREPHAAVSDPRRGFPARRREVDNFGRWHQKTNDTSKNLLDSLESGTGIAETDGEILAGVDCWRDRGKCLDAEERMRGVRTSAGLLSVNPRDGRDGSVAG